MEHYPELLPCGCEYEVLYSDFTVVLLIILASNDRNLGGSERTVCKYSRFMSSAIPTIPLSILGINVYSRQTTPTRFPLQFQGKEEASAHTRK
jgi:hypothetical protein